MKNISRIFAVTMSVVALAGAATVARAQTFTITENFNAATPGTPAQPLFAAVPITVAYAARASESDPWEADFGFPLNVETGGGSNVLGDGFGPILFQLTDSVRFSTFSVDIVPVVSNFTPPTVPVFFQGISGVSLGTFDINRTVAGTVSLPIPAGTVAVIVPTDTQYDNISIVAVTVPEAGALPLAVGGLLALAGAVVVRRRP